MKRFAIILMVATIGVSSAQTAPCPALDSLGGLLATCGVPADSSITGALAAAASGPTAFFGTMCGNIQDAQASCPNEVADAIHTFRTCDCGSDFMCSAAQGLLSTDAWAQVGAATPDVRCEAVVKDLNEACGADAKIFNGVCVTDGVVTVTGPTGPPATDGPSTPVLTTGAPATDMPATDAPDFTDEPNTMPPATDAPEPWTDMPATDAPDFGDVDPSMPPATDAPEPWTDMPATDAPDFDPSMPPATDAPEPWTDMPATGAPGTEAPSAYDGPGSGSGSGSYYPDPTNVPSAYSTMPPSPVGTPMGTPASTPPMPPMPPMPPVDDDKCAQECEEKCKPLAIKADNDFPQCMETCFSACTQPGTGGPITIPPYVTPPPTDNNMDMCNGDRCCECHEGCVVPAAGSALSTLPNMPDVMECHAKCEEKHCMVAPNDDACFQAAEAAAKAGCISGMDDFVHDFLGDEWSSGGTTWTWGGWGDGHWSSGSGSGSYGPGMGGSGSGSYWGDDNCHGKPGHGCHDHPHNHGPGHHDNDGGFDAIGGGFGGGGLGALLDALPAPWVRAAKAFLERVLRSDAARAFLKRMANGDRIGDDELRAGVRHVVGLVDPHVEGAVKALLTLAPGCARKGVNHMDIVDPLHALLNDKKAQDAVVDALAHVLKTGAGKEAARKVIQALAEDDNQTARRVMEALGEFLGSRDVGKVLDKTLDKLAKNKAVKRVGKALRDAAEAAVKACMGAAGDAAAAFPALPDLLGGLLGGMGGGNGNNGPATPVMPTLPPVNIPTDEEVAVTACGCSCQCRGPLCASAVTAGACAMGAAVGLSDGAPCTEVAMKLNGLAAGQAELSGCDGTFDAGSAAAGVQDALDKAKDGFDKMKDTLADWAADNNVDLEDAEDEFKAWVANWANAGASAADKLKEFMQQHGDEYADWAKNAGKDAGKALDAVKDGLANIKWGGRRALRGKHDKDNDKHHCDRACEALLEEMAMTCGAMTMPAGTAPFLPLPMPGDAAIDTNPFPMPAMKGRLLKKGHHGKGHHGKGHHGKGHHGKHFRKGKGGKGKCADGKGECDDFGLDVFVTLVHGGQCKDAQFAEAAVRTGVATARAAAAAVAAPGSGNGNVAIGAGGDPYAGEEEDKAEDDGSSSGSITERPWFMGVAIGGGCVLIVFAGVVTVLHQRGKKAKLERNNEDAKGEDGRRLSWSDGNRVREPSFV